MNTIAERLLFLRGKTKQGDFAKALGVNPNTLRSYENGRSSPNQELLERICVQFSVCAEWLLLGIGSIHASEPTQPAATPDPPPTTTPETSSCARCAKLEAKVDALEEERRELSTELREVNAENRRLARENMELSKQCATLTERQKTCCPDPLLQQPPPSALSSEMRAKA